jgi:hypothetical protein
MNKQKHAEAVASLKEICQEIGCTKVSKACDEAPQLCKIICRLVMPSNEKISRSVAIGWINFVRD